MILKTITFTATKYPNPSSAALMIRPAKKLDARADAAFITSDCA